VTECECNRPRMHALLEAIENLIESAAPEACQALWEAIEGYRNEFPDEYLCLAGPQSPSLLHHMMRAVQPQPMLRAA